MKRLIFAIIIAALLWFAMFSPWTAPRLNFWATMSVSAIVLISLAVISEENIFRPKDINITNTLTGILSVVLLWGIFWIGNFLATRWFGFASEQIGSIYAMKAQSNPLTIAMLLLFLIGPAEEIFWRGFIQNQLSKCYSMKVRSERFGFAYSLIPVAVTTIVYALVHIWSFNFMLVMAAVVCGGFWGLQYHFQKSLWAVIVSHALWDAAVFIVFPI